MWKPVTLFCLAALLAAAGESSAGVVDKLDRRTRIDWTRGLILVTRGASGSLSAPTVTVSRITAQRVARELAEQRLTEVAQALPLAGGGAVASVASKDEQTRRSFEHAVASSVVTHSSLSSDGSVELTVALPLERLRALGTGPVAAPALDPTVTAVVVDARGVVGKPSLGMVLTAGDEKYQGPVVFHDDLEQALADPRLGKNVTRATATKRDGDRLWVASESAFVSSARESAALLVVVIGKKK